MKTFGAELRKARLKNGYDTVRSFCLRFKLEPMLVNRLELEQIAPPTWFLESFYPSFWSETDNIQELAEEARKTIKPIPFSEEEIMGMMPATTFLIKDKEQAFVDIFNRLKQEHIDFLERYSNE